MEALRLRGVIEIQTRFAPTMNLLNPSLNGREQIDWTALEGASGESFDWASGGVGICLTSCWSSYSSAPASKRKMP